MFFEGSEKKVEILLHADGPSLRPLREEWTRVVAASRATIMSSISSEQVDAYLLSESSLFVFDRGAVMITCGTTSLVSAVEEMCTFIDPKDVTMLMFERKNEFFPEAQRSDFDEDVQRLSQLFPGTQDNLGQLDGHFVRVFHYGSPKLIPIPGDMTLELLMHDLSDKALSVFANPELDAETLARETQIQEVIAGFKCDDFLFKPVGYSLNALKDRDYFTFHVTPEAQCSYASFETNHAFDGQDTLMEATIAKVLNIFQPRHFSLVLFKQEQPPVALLEGYLAGEPVDNHFCGYNIRFRNYTRN